MTLKRPPRRRLPPFYPEHCVRRDTHHKRKESGTASQPAICAIASRHMWLLLILALRFQQPFLIMHDPPALPPITAASLVSRTYVTLRYVFEQLTRQSRLTFVPLLVAQHSAISVYLLTVHTLSGAYLTVVPPATCTSAIISAARMSGKQLQRLRTVFRHFS